MLTLINSKSGFYIRQFSRKLLIKSNNKSTKKGDCTKSTLDKRSLKHLENSSINCKNRSYYQKNDNDFLAQVTN